MAVVRVGGAIKKGRLSLTVCYRSKRLIPAFTGVALVAMLVSLLAGCALFGPSPTRVEATITAADDLNPNFEGRPSPLVIRIYELKSIDAFQGSNFFSLYDNEAAALGADILARDEIEVRPGERYNYKRTLNDESRYIGVIGAYRDLDNAQWRASIKVPKNKKSTLAIRLGGLAVSVSIAE